MIHDEPSGPARGRRECACILHAMHRFPRGWWARSEIVRDLVPESGALTQFTVLWDPGALLNRTSHFDSEFS